LTVVILDYLQSLRFKGVNAMKRILVVDDHKEVRGLLSKFFLSSGY